MGPQGAALYGEVLTTLKQALSSSISEVFLLVFAIVVAAFVVNLFLKEIPLRKHN